MAYIDINGNPVVIGGGGNMISRDIYKDKTATVESGITRVYAPVTEGEQVYWSGKLSNGLAFAPSSYTILDAIVGGNVLDYGSFTYAGGYPTTLVIKRSGYLRLDGFAVSGKDEQTIITCFDGVSITTIPYELQRRTINFDSQYGQAYYKEFTAGGIALLGAEQTESHTLPETGYDALALQLMRRSTDLYGATWAQVGDSLTDGSSSGGTGEDENGFGQRIAQKYGLRRFLDFGTNGATYAIRNNAAYDKMCGIAKVDYICAMDEKPDYLTIALGTNDSTSIGSNMTLGDMGSTSTNTLYGAVKYCIEKVRTEMPACRFGIVMPPQRKSTPPMQFTVSDAIRDICMAYSVPCCDMTYESGIDANTLGDGLHLVSGVNCSIVQDHMPISRWKYMRKLEAFLLTL